MLWDPWYSIGWSTHSRSPCTVIMSLPRIHRNGAVISTRNTLGRSCKFQLLVRLVVGRGGSMWTRRRGPKTTYSVVIFMPHTVPNVQLLSCGMPCRGMELSDLSILEKMPAVEVLSLSINNIDTLAHFSQCTALRELYLRRNQVRSLSELSHLTGLENLRVLWLSHNPVANDELYRATVIKTLPLLQKLDDTGK